MGIRIFSSGCSCPGDYAGAPNPNPFNFRAIKTFTTRGYTVALVNYPDCTTFEGNKIIVLRGNKYLNVLKRMDSLDPHFEENGQLVARFEPTEFGWDLACEMISNLPIEKD